MLEQKPIEKIIFMDIETTSQKACFKDLSNEERLLFMERFKKDIDMDIDTIHKKHKSNAKAFIESMEKVYNLKAPLFPEFGKVICISIGTMWKANDKWNIKTTSFASEDEKKILLDLTNHKKLSKVWSNVPGKWEKKLDEFYSLCAHNGLVFDFPFIAKRMIVNGIIPPPMFDFAHLKPWEINFFIDTKKEWTFGVWDGAVSLKLLCHLFNVPTSKDDISGADVKDVFWKEKNLPRIVKYCEKDVVALAGVYLGMKCIKEPVNVFKEISLNKKEVKKTDAENNKNNSEF